MKRGEGEMALFSSLAERLQNTLDLLRKKGRLTEKDINEALREVRRALLEADVNLKVVKEFTEKVKERATGQDVLESLTPAQQVIKIVHEELTALMGSKASFLELKGSPPYLIMLVGLQGSGKTTTTAKLANYLKQQNKSVLLVSADIYRPAAIKQLEVLSEKIGAQFFASTEKDDPVDVAHRALALASQNSIDVVLLDTAGRLHIDEEMMSELERIKKKVDPAEILLVVDAMMGQDAVKLAQAFNERLQLTGVILTKLDGDARGGAALSVRTVTGCPIKFVGSGEKIEAFEVFHPERMASRILGMGDVLSLIEKAQANYDEEKARELEQKLRKQDFTFDDFLDQLQQVKSMGPLEEILNMLPGINIKQMKNMEVDEKDLKHIEAVIQSMTKEERQNPEIISGSRKKRIALGSGTKVQDVNRLLKQFSDAKKMISQLSNNTFAKAGKKIKGQLPFKF